MQPSDKEIRDFFEKLAREQKEKEFNDLHNDQDTDRARGVCYHDPRNDKVNFDQKVWWAPPHFNELRKELYEQWHETLWPQVGWYMAFQAEEFVARMNEWCGLRLPVDSDKVDWTCEQYLKKLRRMRGAA